MEISTEDQFALVFRDFGYVVSKIPESEEKRPDFYLSKSEDHYIVEIKSKEPSQELRDKREAKLENSEVFDESYTLIRQSGLTKTVSEAKNQLVSYKPHKNCFRLICFFGLGHNAEARLEQIQATLYGSTTVCDWSEEDSIKDCYYFGFSDFYRYKLDLDGAILINTQNESGQLLLNNHSPRYEAMKDSALMTTFGSAVIDPLELDRMGRAWVVDSTVDRKDNLAVIDFLRKKYKLSDKVTNIDMKHASVQILTPITNSRVE